jgi:hypothetical protein
MSFCYVCCGRRHAWKFQPWGTVWVPIFCLIGDSRTKHPFIARTDRIHSFFAIDIDNRVFHELERKNPMENAGIDIPLGSLASIAYRLLMLYFMKHSPMDVAYAGAFAGLAIFLAVLIYSIISAASKGTQICNIMTQNAADAGSNSDGNSNDPLIKSTVFKDLDTAARGMLLLFGIDFALLSISFLHHLSKSQRSRKRIFFAVATLAAPFPVQNVVKFVFILIYAQYNGIAALGIQLIYIAFYGLLPVTISACIISIAAFKKRKDLQSIKRDTARWYRRLSMDKTLTYTNIKQSQTPWCTYTQYHAVTIHTMATRVGTRLADES